MGQESTHVKTVGGRVRLTTALHGAPWSQRDLKDCNRRPYEAPAFLSTCCREQLAKAEDDMSFGPEGPVWRRQGGHALSQRSSSPQCTCANLQQSPRWPNLPALLLLVEAFYWFLTEPCMVRRGHVTWRPLQVIEAWLWQWLRSV